VICAVIELEVDATAPTQVELSDHVKTRIAAYKAPRRLVVTDSIGRAPNGKVDYKRWKNEAAAQPA
jgi:fatty-acyl-CoA synthase